MWRNERKLNKPKKNIMFKGKWKINMTQDVRWESGKVWRNCGNSEKKYGKSMTQKMNWY